MLGKEITSYDLQLSRPCIYLPIRQQNESWECVSGRFCLTLARGAPFKGIKVQLVGKMKAPRYGIFVAQEREEVTFERSQTLAFSKTRNAFTMPAGYYEFPFAIPLSGLRFDTLVGPKHEYYTYRVEVTVQRWMWRDLVVSQPVRIYRYPKLDIARSMTKAVAGHSNQDLAYHFSIPDTLIPHGGTFPVDCWFVRLSKSLSVTGITVRVIENHELSLPATAAESVHYSTYFITSSESHVIFEEKHDFALDGGALSEKDADVQQISMPVRLPCDAGACSQSYSSRKIKINHVLLVTVECIDGAGECVKMLAEAIPLHIYMRPTGKDKESRGPTSNEESSNCPPIYGEHQLDLMILDPTEVEGDDQVPSITMCPRYEGAESGEAVL